MKNLTAVVRKLAICRKKLLIISLDNLKDVLSADLSTTKIREMKQIKDDCLVRPLYDYPLSIA